MARSFVRAASRAPIENYSIKNELQHVPSNRTYQMTRRGGRVYQKRFTLDAKGVRRHEFEQEADYIIGSGTRARSYASLSRDGLLHQLPVSWYTQEKRWGMSPGYDHPKHDDFKRKIGHSCLFCHNAYSLLPVASDRFGAEPVMPAALPEGIDCQRCHGPGSEHARLAGKGAPPARIRAAIVNPARLSPIRQAEVCLQCHLQSSVLAEDIRRPDRAVYSYRPGEPLNDYIVHLDLVDPATKRSAGRFEINSAGYRLHQSACFKDRPDAALCTKCHDPHRAQSPEETRSRAKARCIECHRLPTGQVHRDAKALNCAGCHMPTRRAADVVHATVTDHRIQRPTEDETRLARRSEEYTVGGVEVAIYDAGTRSSPEADLYLGMAELEMPALAEAGLRRLGAALERIPVRTGEPSIRAGLASMRQNRFEAASTHFRKALSIESNHSFARISLAEALRLNGESSAAANEYRKVIAAREFGSNAEYGLAQIAAGEHRWEEAIERLTRCVAMSPQLPECHATLGVAYSQSGRYPAAIAALLEALRLDPGLNEARMTLALVYSVQRARGLSRDAFREALRWSTPADTNLLEEANRSLTALCDREADDVECRNTLGIVELKLGRTAESADHFRVAIEKNPEYAEAHVNLGVALAKLDRVDEAIQHYRVAVRLNPLSSAALNNLGGALGKLGRLTEAAEAFQRATALNPSDGTAHYNLGLIYSLIGDHARSKEELRTLENIDPARALSLRTQIGLH